MQVSRHAETRSKPEWATAAARDILHAGRPSSHNMPLLLFADQCLTCLAVLVRVEDKRPAAPCLGHDPTSRFSWLLEDMQGAVLLTSCGSDNKISGGIVIAVVGSGHLPRC